MTSEEEFEREMAAISTVYGLRPGRTLTQEDFDAIQLYDKVQRRDEQRATDAFHDGYMQGLREGGSADIEEMRRKLDDQFCRHGVDMMMRKLAEDRCDKLQTALKNLLDLPGINNLPGFATGIHIVAARGLLPAQGIEAGTAETALAGSVHESPVPEGDAPQ